MKDAMSAGDELMGHFVYCSQHCRVHSTGWCTVSPRDKVSLTSKTLEEAIEEEKQLGLNDLKWPGEFYKWKEEHGR